MEGLIRCVISEHPNIIKNIIRYEESPELNRVLGWEYNEVFADPMVLYQLMRKGFIKRVYNTNNHKGYLLANFDMTKKLYQEFLHPKKDRDDRINKIALPDDLFKYIIGYEDLKKVFQMSIQAIDPVHILLVGVPASAKSLFLMEIERLEGAVFCAGGSTTKAGLQELLFGLPRYLIIEEIDKIKDANELSSLLLWMESGRATSTKHNNRYNYTGKGWVFAAANRIDKLSPELLSRFMVFHLKEYSTDDFKKIVTNILIYREKVNKDLSVYIAEQVSRASTDVRDALKIARLATTTEMVDFLLQTKEKYK